jgi:ArsR family transcriptional regulator
MVMTKSKANGKGELLEIAEALKVMGHPIRLNIMLKLAEQCCCVREIWEYLQIPQADVSQHLKILKDHRVLEARREGAKVCYLITDSRIRDIVRTLEKNVAMPETVSA